METTQIFILFGLSWLVWLGLRISFRLPERSFLVNVAGPI